MRADKATNIAKVAKVVLTNPLASQREIADETWLSLGNVNDKLNNLEHLAWKDGRIIWITDKDLENIEAMQALVASKIKNPKEMKNTRIWELAQAMKEATARYSLFRWNATDEQGGLKWIQNIDIV